MAVKTGSVIVAGVRTPIGAMMGRWRRCRRSELGATCIKADFWNAQAWPADRIDEVIMGNVVRAGLGQNPARQAAIYAGLPPSVGAMTVNKVCGSGLKAVMLADQAIRLRRGRARRRRRHGEHEPGTLPADEGPRGLPHGQRRARRRHDPRRPLGRLRQQAHGHLRRPLRRQVRLHQAAAGRLRRPQPHPRPQGDRRAGVFAQEIVPVEVTVRGKTTRVETDEGPSKFDEAEAPRPEAGLRRRGDDHRRQRLEHQRRRRGAAGRLARPCDELGLKPLARIVGAASLQPGAASGSPPPRSGPRRSILKNVGWWPRTRSTSSRSTRRSPR